MWPNPQENVDLVTFTEEILNGKFHFLCSVWGNMICLSIANLFFLSDYKVSSHTYKKMFLFFMP